MPHVDMPINYRVWDAIYIGTLSKTHAKAGQHHDELKGCFIYNFTLFHHFW